MRFIADFHVHSHLSRATSPGCNLRGLASWARVKGIQVVGTGDFTHPGWLSEIRENLVEAEPGLFKLKEDIKSFPFSLTPEARPVRFLLTVEVSCIYKKNGRTRKNHNLIFVPDIKSAEKFNSSLAKLGNIESDGRPILGLDAKNLLEIVLGISQDAFLIPAHVWTPWFSLFGSKSGFDDLKDCFEDLSKYIFALETGLSSDPLMNWRVSKLDPYTLVSNSDAHSPSKLGREANLFDCGMDYFSMRDALRNSGRGFSGTIEFYPEEGKYHFDGHRKCQVVMAPEETKKNHGLCPVCGKPVTVGVMNRVMALADRREPVKPSSAAPFYSLIPLGEVLACNLGVTPVSKKVLEEYVKLINRYGSEFNVLLNLPLEEMKNHRDPLLHESIKRMREGNVKKEPGYDGTYGRIILFDEEEKARIRGQETLFEVEVTRRTKKDASVKEPQSVEAAWKEEEALIKGELNEEQRAVIDFRGRTLIVSAGPGTGKTLTLTRRIALLVRERSVKPGSILALTFTNRAAREMRTRLKVELGKRAQEIVVSTIHSFCLDVLREKARDLKIFDERERKSLLQFLLKGNKKSEINDIADKFTLYYKTGKSGEPDEDESFRTFRSYQGRLKKIRAMDMEGIIPEVVRTLRQDRERLEELQDRFRHIFIDEFQDLDAIQYELVRILSGPDTSVFVIGDPDQAIYGFRGYSLEYFFKFPDDFNAEKMELAKNYRNAASIIKGAESIISRNSRKSSAKLTPISGKDRRIWLVDAPTDKAEAEFIISTIENLTGGVSFFSVDSGRARDKAEQDISFGDVAVLFRTMQIFPALEEAFHRSGIPFQVVGSTPYYLKTPLEGVLCFLKIAENEEGFFTWQQLIKHYVKGLGETVAGRVMNEMEKRAGSKERFDSVSFIEKISSRLSGKQRSILRDLRENVMKYRNKVKEQGLRHALTGLYDFLDINPEEEGPSRFLDFCASFGKDSSSLLDYVRENSTVSYDEKTEAVSLMSMHAAKGLEFKVVFITGCEQGLVPLERSGRISDMEEERRLFYVAMTRAKERLILSHAGKRLLYGRHVQNPVSEFIREIPSGCLEEVSGLKRRPRKEQLRLFE